MPELKEYELDLGVTYTLREVKDGWKRQIATGGFNQEYEELPIDGVVAVQAVLDQVPTNLNGLGFAKVDSLGMSEKLEALGFSEEVEKARKKTKGK